MNDPSQTLYATFQATADRIPDSPAFTFLDQNLTERQYTYRQLFTASQAIANSLRDKKLPREAPLGLLLQSQESQVLHYLAASSLGMVPAILTPPNRKLQKNIFIQTIKALVKVCGFSAIISDPEILDADIEATVLETVSLRTVNSKPRQNIVPVDQAALLQFSSGTTGTKRGVLVSHQAVLHQLHAYARAIRLQPEDRILSWLPLYHDMGFMACLNMPLACGVHAIMIQPLDWVTNPAMFIQAATKYRATLSWNPNFAYAFMADRIRNEQLAGMDLASFRGLINCSEPVTFESQNRFLARFAAVGLKQKVFFGCYAMAETTFAVTHGECGDPHYLDSMGPLEAGFSMKLPLVSVGRPLEGVELAVKDDEGNSLTDRKLGEIWIKSAFNFEGYYNNKPATESAFSDGWYKTGDMGYRAGEEFFICSRKKDLLILSGINVFPHDVEDAASAIEGVIAGRAVAFSIFDPHFQTEKLILLAETATSHDQHSALIIKIRQYILALFQVANFEVHLVTPQWLIKSSSGKLARHMNQNKWTELMLQNTPQTK